METDEEYFSSDESLLLTNEISVVEDTCHAARMSKKKKLLKLPHNLTYDGSSSWSPFKLKFQKYADAYDWTEEDCLNCLCWALTGKAADFYALLIEQNKHSPFRSLMQRLEKRFGITELPEEAQVRFFKAAQEYDESLEDWSDRVMMLASRAFKELPSSYATQQSVLRFCFGLYDKKVAMHVSMKRPKTMEEALDVVRWYNHVNSTIGSLSRSSRENICLEDVPAVYAVTRQDPEVSPESSDLSAVVLQLVDEVRVLTDEVKKLKSGCQCQRKTGGRKNERKNACWTCGSESHLKSGCPKMKCFKCGEIGHKKKRCPMEQKVNSHVNKVCSIRSEEKKACVVSNHKEHEVGNVSDVADQKWSVSLGIAKKTRPAMCYPRKTSKHTTSATSGAEGQRCHKPHYKVKVRVDDKEVAAVVDTAAEVTIISEDVFNAMKVKPRKVKDVKLFAAGNETMNSSVVGPMKLKIGSKVYTEFIHVAPIAQEMLLGFDILHKKAVLNMRNKTLNVDGSMLPLIVEDDCRQK